MAKRVLWFLAGLALLSSCQKFAEHQRLFGDMMVLKDQIATEFHEGHVQVNVIHEGTVVVSFINSPLNSGPPEERQKRADEVATFVTKHSERKFPEVRVLFVSQSEAGAVTRLDRFTGQPKP